MSVWIMFLIFFFLLVVGMPVAFSLGLSSLAYIAANGLTLSMVPQKMTTSLESFMFVALPLFILAGEIMSTGGITRKLVNISRAIVGQLKGGLAYVNVVVSMLFGGVQGMATADTVAIGSLLIPTMKDEGYDLGFATAVTVASSTIGSIIPPSLLFIVFGAATGVSIGDLFLGGFIPGVTLGLAQMLYIFYLSKSPRHADKIPAGERLTSKERLRFITKGLPTLLLPVIIIGGICTGVVTTTESAVLAVAYAIVYCLLTRELTLPKLGHVLVKSAQTIGSCMIILCASSLFGYVLTAEKVPQMVVGLLTGLTDNKYILLFIIDIFLLLVGTFMDATPATMILAPILLPVMSALGLSPVHIGVLVCFALVIGLITPPVGACLYLASGISHLSMEKISAAVMPFIIVNAVVLLLVTYLPFMTTLIPSLIR